MKKLIYLLTITSLTLGACNFKKEPKENTEEPKTNVYEEYEELAYEIILQAKGILGMNLISSIQSGGAPHAVEFCSEKAIYLTDSVASANQVKIRRAAKNFRNPINAATENDLAYIEMAEEMLKDGSKPEPQVVEKENKLEVRYPILTDELCLQCHGKVNDHITPENYSKILSVYPDDKATGFEAKSLRGIWVVEMNR